MSNHILKYKKILVLPIMVVMLFFSVNIPRANADPGFAVPTGDSTSWFTTIGEFAAKKIADIALEAGRMSLDSASYALGQMLLNQVTDNIVGWVKGGFNGSPAFAVDPNKLFLDTANMVSGGLAREVLGLQNCNFDSLFNINLSNSIALSTRSGYQAKFANSVRCPFPNNGAQEFYNDFSKGGWRAFETALSDRGNPFGTKMLVSQENATRQAEAQDIKKQELGWAGGFLSMADTGNCTYPDGMNPDLNDFTGLERTDSEKRTLRNTHCQKTTPGKIVGDKLTQALGADMNRLGFVDNINKILGAVITQLSRQAMSGIFSQDSSGGNTSGPTYVPTITQAVIIGNSSGSKVATIPIGQAGRFANSTSCVGPSACAAFTLVLSGGIGIINSIKITETGGVSANTDLSNLALFYNTDGNFSNGTTRYGTTTPSFDADDTATVTGSSLILVPSTMYYFYVRFDAMSPNKKSMPTTDQTVGFQIAKNSDVVVEGSATTGAPKSLVGLTTFN